MVITVALPAVAGAQGLVLPADLLLSNTITAEPIDAPEPKATPWWATSLAVAGPLADGLSTVYAINQSGPNAQIVEGNGFYHKLFGADVKPAEIMAFKVGQAALMGTIVHYAGKQSRALAIGAAIAQAGINFWVASQNVRQAQHAKRLNAGLR